MIELTRPFSGLNSDNYKATDLPADLLMLLVWEVVYSFLCMFTEHISDCGETFRCKAVVCTLESKVCTVEVLIKGIHTHSALCYQQRSSGCRI